RYDLAARQLHDHLRGAFGGAHEDVPVRPALEAVRCIGRKSKLLRCAANATRFEVGGLDQYVFRRFPNTRILTGHNAGNTNRRFQCIASNCSHFPGDTDMTQAIGSVWSDTNFEDRILDSERGGERRTTLKIQRQFPDAFVLRGNSEFALGADHAFTDLAANLG